MDKKHKFIGFILAVLGISGLTFGVYSIYDNLYSPFRREGEIKSITELNEESQLNALRQVLSLQDKDSDADGLNDYEELYTYGTSPYLADTDSDGISDLIELETGGDPLCHKYQDCSGQDVVTPEPPQELEDQIPTYPEMQFIDEAGLADILIPDMTPAEIRELLRENGATAQQLEAFSDDDLMGVWQEVLLNAEAEMPFE